MYSLLLLQPEDGANLFVASYVLHEPVNYDTMYKNRSCASKISIL